MTATKQAISRANTKYQKLRLKTYVMRLNKKRDSDLIAYLDQTGNVAGTLKRLVREEMKRTKWAPPKGVTCDGGVTADGAAEEENDPKPDGAAPQTSE